MLRCWLAFIALFALAVTPAHATPASEKLEAILAPLVGEPLGPFVLSPDVKAERHRITLHLRATDGGRDAHIELRHPGRRGHSVGSFAVNVRASFSQARTAARHARLDAIQQVLAHLERGDPGTLGPSMSAPHPNRWLSLFPQVPLALGGISLVALLLGWLRAGRPVPGFKLQHLIPAAIQVTLYTYWSLYVSTVSARFVDIAAQLLFAYAVDLGIAAIRGRRWRLTFGPLPIVFSTNLFVWFANPVEQCAVIVFALVSKAWITRRTGGHIFNPSAFGISVLAAATLLLPGVFGWGSPTPDTEMNIPPNMVELMLVLALAAQLRFPIVLVPLGAVAGLGLFQTLGLRPPNPWWPATLLILLLFSTDPRTLPRTNPGRLLFGLLFGVAIGSLSWFLTSQRTPDVYAKVLPIPLLNLLAPRLDAWADRLHEAWCAFWQRLATFGRLGPLRHMTATLTPAHNRLHVAGWVLLAILSVRTQKARAFQTLTHWTHETPHITAAEPLGFPDCDLNPVWCEPFSFVGEARMWLAARSEQPPDPPHRLADPPKDAPSLSTPPGVPRPRTQ
jgi:hypothetical protein